MSSVRKVLFDNLNRCGLEGFSVSIKKCIQQGFVDPKDLKLFSQMTFDYIDKLSLSQTTSLLHSFSIPNYRNFQLFSSLTSRIKNLLENEPVSVEDSIRIINSCGRLHYSDSKLFHILLGVVKDNLENIRTKNIVSILHSLTKLRYTDYDLLSNLSLVTLDKLDEISDIALANFSIAVSKIYSIERMRFEKDSEILEYGIRVLNSLIPEIKSRCLSSSSLDNLRHIIALSNMKHLITDSEELNQCLDHLLKFINCSVLYYEHIVILLECLVSLNLNNTYFTFQTLIPNLLNKRTETNTTFEFDLRLLKGLLSIFPIIETKIIDKNEVKDTNVLEEDITEDKENKNKEKEDSDNKHDNETYETKLKYTEKREEETKEHNNNINKNNTFYFLLDQILGNLSKNLDKNPNYIGDIFILINKFKNLNQDIFLKYIQSYLEKENCYLDSDTILHIKESISLSNKDWSDLMNLVEKRSNL